MGAPQEPGIDCPIDLFPKQERRVAAATAAINEAGRPADKAQHARELLEAVQVLLDCEAYDASNRNCRLCREFSQLRRKTAKLVTAAGGQG